MCPNHVILQNKMAVLAFICLAAVVATDALPSLNLSAGHPKHPDVIMDGKHSGSAQLPVCAIFPGRRKQLLPAFSPLVALQAR